MRRISPLLNSTSVSPDGHEWLPTNFDAFLQELQHIVAACSGDDPAPLFRGQSDYSWPLECTFVRNFISRVFSLTDYRVLTKQIRRSVAFHKSVLSMLLLKFGVIGKPSDEAFEREKGTNIDPWYESLKYCQQYPENDHFIQGTFLTDWTTSHDIAIYFANDGRTETGAVWICDSPETGKTLQVKKLGEILEVMNARNFSDQPAGVPLLFHPSVQTFQPRAANQRPVYVAQMDYRCDIADYWVTQELALGGRLIFIKLILPPGSSEACNVYLSSKGITREVVYPH